MSYIAKVYLNKMFKKEECLTIEGDQLKIKVYNVLNPIVLAKPPKNVYEHLEITSGGKLEILLKKDRLPYYRINPISNPSNQPRMALGYSIGSILAILSKCKIVNINEEEIIESIKYIEYK